MVFDLASTYTSIEVVGQPGSKKWKVLFHRRGMSPVVVDSTMVDAHDFMRVLRFFRPGIGSGRHDGGPGLDPVAELAVAGVLVDTAAALDGACRGQVVVVARHERPVDAEPAARRTARPSARDACPSRRRDGRTE